MEKKKKKSMYSVIICCFNKLSIGSEFDVDTMYRLCKEQEPELHWNKDYIYQVLIHCKNAKFVSQKVNTKVYQKLREFSDNLNLCDLAIIGRQIKSNENG